MLTVKEVRNGLRTALEGATREANERSKKAVRAGAKYLIATTPVDTTKALSNWTVGLSAPNKVELDPRGDSRDVSGAAVYAEVDRIIRTKKAGQSAYLTNNAPYITRLNAGSSQQAPAGFIENAGVIMREELKKPSGWSKRGR